MEASRVVARRDAAPTDLGKLFKRLFKFFRFYALVNGLFVGLSVAMFYVAANLGIFDLEVAKNAILSGRGEEIAAFYSDMMNPAAYAYFGVMQMFYGAFAVPMAANAHACTPKGRDIKMLGNYIRK